MFMAFFMPCRNICGRHVHYSLPADIRGPAKQHKRVRRRLQIVSVWQSISCGHGDVMTISNSLMSVPGDYRKLVPALRPYFHQITGVVRAASWRRNVRKRIFHDSLSPIQAVGTENVSFQKPVSFGLWPVAPSNCLGNLLRAVQPHGQFLGSVPSDNSYLIFTTVVVRHVFSP